MNLLIEQLLTGEADFDVTDAIFLPKRERNLSLNIQMDNMNQQLLQIFQSEWVLLNNKQLSLC